MPIRPILLALAALVAITLPASARQLAVGAAAGFHEPPGYRAVPVYTWPRGASWSPVDTSLGYAFREPLYTTPRGYRYVYVRGYYWKRLPAHGAPRAYRRPVKVSTVKRARSAPCVTDAGFGRYEMCRRWH
ncbi:hypothetical protein [Pseudorhodoplanes sp.]|uniref:hypothetical protein n=1 Tax=Pseudorhodoplanes sp. TaxID=1934341 RepID=UPI00391B1566